LVYDVPVTYAGASIENKLRKRFNLNSLWWAHQDSNPYDFHRVKVPFYGHFIDGKGLIS
jgi:hypothetical protein